MSETTTIDYNEQMLNYYPEVFKAIREFQVLIATQSLQIEQLHEELEKILGNAYISTCDDTTLVKWERALGITPLLGSSEENRRSTILARLYNTPKLNTQSISEIVKIFTGGSAVSYFENGTIHVLITPPENDKDYQFEDVKQELRKKIPAHLSLQCEPNYFTWNEVFSKCATWDDVNSSHNNWNDVLYQP